MRKIILFCTILLTILMVYYSIGVNPDWVFFKLLNYKVGINFSAYWLLKPIIIIGWGSFFYLSIKEESK
jgi:hypothetical protein